MHGEARLHLPLCFWKLLLLEIYRQDFGYMHRCKKRSVYTHAKYAQLYLQTPRCYEMLYVMVAKILYKVRHFGVEWLDLVYSLMMKRWVCGGMKKKKREGCCIKWDLFHYLPWMRVKLLHTSTSLGYLWVPHGSKGPLMLPFHSPPQHLRVCMCVYIHTGQAYVGVYSSMCIYSGK